MPRNPLFQFLRRFQIEAGAVGDNMPDQVLLERFVAEHDQSDHVALTRLTQELRDLEGEVAATEARWLELSEMLE